MTETVEIKAVQRNVVGKASRRLSAQGLVPAVLYGAGVDPTALAVDRHDFEMFLQHNGVAATIVHLSVNGAKPVNAIVKDMQSNSVKGSLTHVDFMAVKMNQPIKTVVPAHVTGESPGVKAGGVLTQTLHELHIEALPKDLPEHIDVDISDLDVGGSLHVSDMMVPPGITILDDAETIVCSVTPPTVEPTVEEALAAEEPVLVGATEEESE